MRLFRDIFLTSYADVEAGVGNWLAVAENHSFLAGLYLPGWFR
jgi:hypothetical protein